MEKQKIPNDLLAVFVLTVLLILFVIVPAFRDSPLRILLGAMFVLFLPGYVLIATLFPGKGDLDPLFRLALSFFMSIALVSLLGLALSYTPLGVRLTPVLAAITILIILLTGTASYRRLKTSPEDQLDFSFSQLIEFIGVMKAYRHCKPYFFLLLISVVLSLGVVYYGATHPQSPESFTEFYVLDNNMLVDNYTKNLRPNQTAIANVIVVNREHSDASYILNVRVEGGNASSDIFKKEIALEHNETWEGKIPYSVPEPGAYELKFLLYKDKITEKPYRRLHLWLDVQ